MNANELRIGNLVNRKYLNPSPKGLNTCYTDCKIMAIGIERVIYECKDKSLNKVNFDIISPIPLTEKIIENLGFSVITENSMGKRYGYVIDGIFSSDLTFTFWKTTKEAGNFFRGDLQLKSVHQIQNLYFALTGEELVLSTAVS
jgi:hypothetical protein